MFEHEREILEGKAISTPLLRSLVPARAVEPGHPSIIPEPLRLYGPVAARFSLIESGVVT